MSLTPSTWSVPGTGGDSVPGIGGAQPAADFTLNGPKRVCCACKRDKIPCDRERPCSSCVRKGFRPEQCIDGCRVCRQARLLCSGGKPCADCLQKQEPCLDPAETDYEASDSLAGEEAALPPIRTQSGERAKLACMACRRDNKKCDNNRPCARCASREEECVHVEKAPRSIKRRCQACRLAHNKCEDARPCRYCVESGVECVDVLRKGSGPRSKVKSACAYCRRTKIQCEEDRPCKNCTRRGIECVTHEEQSRQAEGRSAPQAPPLDADLPYAHAYDTDRQGYHAYIGEPLLPGIAGPSMSMDANVNALQGDETFNSMTTSVGPSTFASALDFVGAGPGWPAGSSAEARATYYAYATQPPNYAGPSRATAHFPHPERYSGFVGDVYAYGTEAWQMPPGPSATEPGSMSEAQNPDYPQVDLLSYVPGTATYDDQQSQQHSYSEQSRSSNDGHAS